MAFIEGRHPFVKEMMKILGVPKNAVGFHLHVAHDTAVTVDVEYLVEAPTRKIIAESFMLCLPEDIDHVTKIAEAWLQRVREGRQ